MAYKPESELAQATDRDFERAVLPFLQILWPDLTRVSPRGHWDRRGIDLITDVERRPLQCCVQCKGFSVPVLGADQYRQILESIKSFRNSGLKTENYIIVHNRDARNRKNEAQVESALEELVSAGCAVTAELWDRQELFTHLKATVRNRLIARIASIAKLTLQNLEQIYGPQWAWQYHVPVATQRMRFKREGLAECTDLSSYKSRHIREVLFGDENVRWTMVTGAYGMGKTTASLLAAHHTDSVIVRAECRQFDDSKLGSGMNALTKEIVRSLGVEPPIESCRQQFDYLAGRELSAMLRDPSNQYALILDGLDENRHYSRHRGLVQLTSQLAEVQCPIILVTRREHFDARFGDISTSMFDLSRKNGLNREAVIANLGYWGETELLKFLEEMGERLEGAQLERIKVLIGRVRDGTATQCYGSLLFHPLLLSFIVDDVLNEGVRSTNRVSLIENWTVRKIWRDRKIDRVTLGGDVDIGRFVELMLRLTEKIALQMLVKKGQTVELREQITEDEVLLISSEIFPSDEKDILGILLNSVLITNGVRRIGHPLRLSFSHRLLQEYFTARGLAQNHSEIEGFPTAITELFHEYTMEQSGTGLAPKTTIELHEDSITLESLNSETIEHANVTWDVFVSHASEDKEEFVRPLAKGLRTHGLKVWFDEFTLTVGDSLRRSIDRGLARSRFGIVVISPNFIRKEWPQKELDGLVAREISGVKVILPVWHGVTADEIRAYSPILADRLAASSEKGLDHVIVELVRAIQLHASLTGRCSESQN